MGDASISSQRVLIFLLILVIHGRNLAKGHGIFKCYINNYSREFEKARRRKTDLKCGGRRGDSARKEKPGFLVCLSINRNKTVNIITAVLDEDWLDKNSIQLTGKILSDEINTTLTFLQSLSLSSGDLKT